MAQFFFDPNDWAVDDTEATPGFPFSVLQGSAALRIDRLLDNSGNLLNITTESSGRNIIAYTPAGQHTDLEVYVQSYQSYDGNSSAERTGLRARNDGAGGDFYQHRSGSIDTVINGSLSAISGSVLIQDRRRFRANGTSPTTLQVRNWTPGQDEPVGWETTTTNSAADLQVAGYAAITPYSGAIRIAYLGVGTNGDSAPTSAVAAGPNTPINLSVTNLLVTSARLNWEQG